MRAGVVEVRAKISPVGAFSVKDVAKLHPTLAGDKLAAPMGPRTPPQPPGRFWIAGAASWPSLGSGMICWKSFEVADFHTIVDHVSAGPNPCLQIGSPASAKVSAVDDDAAEEPTRAK